MSTFQRSVEWQRKAIRLALDTMPNRGAQEFPMYGHAEQLLSRSTIQEQVESAEGISRHDAARSVGQWARTGKWPRVSRHAAFFLEEALREALPRCSGVSESGNIAADFHAPPWSKDDSAWLSALVLSEWDFVAWLRRWVDQEYQSQERIFRSYHL